MWSDRTYSSLPVAKRTRLQEALGLQKLYNERKRGAGGSTSGRGVDSGDDVVFLGEAGVSGFSPEACWGENGGRKSSNVTGNERGYSLDEDDVSDYISISDGSESSESEAEEIASPAFERKGKEKEKEKEDWKRKSELGTSSNPFRIEDLEEGEEEEEEQEEEEQEESEEEAASSSESDGGVDQEKSSRRKEKSGLKNCNAFRILLDSIWEEDGELLEEIVSPGDTSDPNEEKEPELEYDFEWPPGKSTPMEKSPYEIEMDGLWEEFDFSLRSAEIDSKKSDVVGQENFEPSETKVDQAVLCGQGRHQLVLDEQIGLVCRCCSFIQLEIKHIFPDFARNSWGQWDKRSAGNMDCNNIFDELQFQNPVSGLWSDSGHGFLPDGTVWDIIPGVKKTMYKHQQEGFEFIWKNVAGGINLDELKRSACPIGGSGCIISHAPGTGKTRLTIVFLQAYMELYPSCRPVIIAPCSMLLTWEEEFKKWNVDIPFHNLNRSEYSGRENITALNFLRKVTHRGQTSNTIRLVKLYSWKKDRSILGISYTLFEKLTGERVLPDQENKKIRERKNIEGDEVRKILQKLPGLLVLDEGHTPRNEQSLIWKALSKIDTGRRIILSGTPFQNNFRELRNTLSLVRPKFDGKITEHYGVCHRKRGRKANAANGKWELLTSAIGKVPDHESEKIEELRAMIEPFVHIHKGTILQENLPGLKDAAILLQPSALQKRLLEGVRDNKNPLKLGYLVSLISVHPFLLPSYERKELVDQNQLEKVKMDPDVGVKTKFLMEFVRLSEALNEKVLVFSEFIDPLTYLINQFKHHFHWRVGQEVLYMVGHQDVKQRQASINTFNDPASDVRILLASTKACSEGISLVGASRVILLDVVWNPSVERQAISRAYRLGQKKMVYIYHLLTSGTMEAEKYCRQAKKDQLSELVFSSKDKNGGGNKFSPIVEDKVLEEMVQHRKLKNMFDKIINQPKESNLVDTFGLVDIY